MSLTQNLTFPAPLKPHETWDILDSSKLNCFMKCPRKFFYRYLLGWEKEGDNHNVVFGSAWHSAMEAMLKFGYNRNGIEEGFENFLKTYREFFSEATDSDYSPKNPANALLALSEYAEHWKHDNFEVLYQEVSGALPIDDEGTEIYFRLDNIIRDHPPRNVLGDKDDGVIISLEHKTSKYNQSWWVDQWALALQPSLYTHVLFSLFEVEQVFGVKINGAFFKKGGNEFLRVPVRKTLGQMNSWLEELQRWVQMLKVEMFKLSVQNSNEAFMAAFPKNPNSCLDYMKLCEYHPFCTSWNNPLQRCETMQPGFTQRFWDPRAEDKTQWSLENGKLEKKQ